MVINHKIFRYITNDFTTSSFFDYNILYAFFLCNLYIQNNYAFIDANTNYDVNDFVSMNNELAKYTKDLNKRQNFRLTKHQSMYNKLIPKKLGENKC